MITKKEPPGRTTNLRNQEEREQEEMQRLIAVLTENGHSVAVSFNNLVTKCREIGAFDWRFYGFSPAQNRTWFGKMFSRNCGTFILQGDKQVEFSREGSDQSRYYLLKIRTHSIANCES